MPPVPHASRSPALLRCLLALVVAAGACWRSDPLQVGDVPPIGGAGVPGGNGGQAGAFGGKDGQSGGGDLPLLGVYRGLADNATPNVGGPAAHQVYEQWLGRPVPLGQDYEAYWEGTWASLEGPDSKLVPWQQWASTDPSRELQPGVELMPSDTLEECAAGNDNPHWQRLAQNLVAVQLGRAIIRLNSDFNRSGQTWSAQGHVDAYKGCFAQVVTTMRAVPGAAMRFDWNASTGTYPSVDTQQLAAEQAYPGDAYVDFVGLSVFDTDPRIYPTSGVTDDQHTAAWNEIVNSAEGLAFWRDFARAHGKPLSFPSWGVVEEGSRYGGGDDAAFVQRMHDFMVDPSNGVAYASYYDMTDDTGDSRLSPGDPSYPGQPGYGPTRFPNAAARFQQLFGP